MKTTYALAVALIGSITSLWADGRRVAPLNDASWGGSEWISVADAPQVTGLITDRNMRAADGASCFVSTITNRKVVKSAIWMTTGLGVYYLYVNGSPIGEEILKPGFTHPDKTKLSFTYDITDVFDTKAGAVNVLAAQVTPGWWADKIVTPWDSDGMTGRKTAFRAVLQLTYADGTSRYLTTNTEDWRAGIAGPVTHAAIFDGEEYDARIAPGFLTPEKLTVPEVNTEFRGEIIPSSGAEVYFREDLRLAPREMYVWSGISGKTTGEHGSVIVSRRYDDGETIELDEGENLVVDFGQNCAAVPEFEFASSEGVTLTCLPSEILNDGNGAESRGMDGPEGSIHRRNLRFLGSGMKLHYTFGNQCNDEGYVKYRPECTFFGYRYVSISATGKVRIKSVRSVPVTSIAQNLETGRITTGNDDINKLISNTIWGMRSNYLSVPTDCPQRDERLGWLADTQVFAETGTFFADTKEFFHKWLRDVRDTQHPLGGYPGVAPAAQYGSFDTDIRLGWADAGIIVPWTVWKQFADTAIVNESWESMERFMDHIASVKYDHNLLAAENGNYQWADWLSYEPLESWSGAAFNEKGPLPDAVDYWNYLSANYWLMDAGLMADMARATGRDPSKYEAMARDARRHIHDNFLTPDGTFKTAILNTMQTPALFALKNGLVDGSAKERMKLRLRENFEKHGNCLQTGFLGTSILMQTLTENGMDDIAFELLFQRKNPSWLYSIDNGATTIWERWNSYMTEHGMGPAGMNSFNHYAYGCVCEWIWETLAGIAADPSAPGFTHIVMKPIPDRRLGFVEAEYKSAAGAIKSSWRYDGDNWIWTLTIPDGACATVTLPGEPTSKDYTAGTYTITKPITRL